MLKRTIAILAVLAIVAALFLTGCTGEEATTTTAAPATTAPATDAPTSDTPTEPTGPVLSGELNVSALKTAYGENMWTEVAAAFNTIYPDVKVNITYDAKLEDTMPAQMEAGQYPDVVHLATGRKPAVTESQITAKKLLALTDVMSMTVPGETKTVADKILPGFMGSSATEPYGDGVVYLAPTFFGACGLVYNAGLFAEKGWTVPTTWDEMWALGDKVKADGISLFCYPTAGYFDSAFWGLANNIGGKDLATKVANYAEGLYDAEGKQILDILAKIASYTDKTVPANANNDNYLKNQELIMTNKALFMPCGTWVVGEMASSTNVAPGFQWGMTSTPAVTAGGDSYSQAWFEQAWIPADAKNQDNAKAWIAFLYSDAAMAIMGSDTNGNAVMSAVGATAALTGVAKDMYGIFDRGAKLCTGSFGATNPVDGIESPGAIWFDTLNSVVSGDKTAEQYIAAVKEANDKLRAALIK